MQDKNIRRIESEIFQELKDSKDNYKYMIRKYEGCDIDFERLHSRILSYQRKVYGCTLRELEKIKKERLKNHGRSRSLN